MVGEKSTTTKKQIKKFARDILAAGSAATISKTAVAPLERVKILLQVQYSHKDIKQGQRYKGILDALVRVPREQRFWSLWRGNAVNVVRYVPTQALNFAFHGYYSSHFLKGIDKEDQFWRYVGLNMMSGGCAGATAMAVSYPLDVVRLRLSSDVGRDVNNRQYKGALDCCRKTFREGGLRALYRGFFVSTPVYFVYRAIYFGANDAIRHLYHRDSRKINFLSTYLIAQSVSIASSLVVYPWDTVRNRMLIKGELGSSSAWTGVKKVYVKEGWRGFYKGALANSFRTCGGALVLTFYHEFEKYF
ncbi:unnamed protein product, partial [Mesorhabditis spiculigera]